jgi:4-amino-4-deoxy-L-arabinose transferase-like glycosyltransferase
MVSPSLIMAAAALVVLLPAIFNGYPTGHDSFLHATAWFDTLTHWHEGNFFPGWSSRFAMGWGQPIAIFYPPLSFNGGALCLLLFGPYFAPIIFAWAVLTLAGYAAYRFTKLLVSENFALIAGVTYILSPYLGLNLYERNAFGELMAASIFPFVLYAYVRVQRDQRSPLLLACGLCLMLLTNIPAMAITAGILAVLTLVDARRTRSVLPIVRSAIAGAIALCLSAFYLIPVIAQKDIVKLHLVATGGQAPVNNFELFGGHELFKHEFFSYLALISTILALLLIVIVAASWKWNTLPMRQSWVATTAFSLVLMFPFTAKLYSLPGMKYINFPWRFLFVISLLIGLFLAHAVSRSKKDWWMVAFVAVGFAAAWFAMWPPTFLHDPYASWGKYSDMRTAGLPGVQELMPISAHYNEDGNYGPAELVSVESGAPCKALQVLKWHSEHRVVRFDCPPDTTLVIKTFFYPGWRILANSRPAPVAFNEKGAFLVKVQGTGILEMQFSRTQDRIAGALISLITLLLCAVYILWLRNRQTSLIAT